MNQAEKNGVIKERQRMMTPEYVQALLSQIHFVLAQLSRQPLPCGYAIGINLNISESIQKEMMTAYIQFCEKDEAGNTKLFAMVRKNSNSEELDLIPYNEQQHKGMPKAAKVADEEGWTKYTHEFMTIDLFKRFKKIKEESFDSVIVKADLLRPLLEAGIIIPRK